MNKTSILAELKSWLKESDLVDPELYNTHLKKISIGEINNTIYICGRSKFELLELSKIKKDIVAFLNKLLNKENEVVFASVEEFQKIEESSKKTKKIKLNIKKLNEKTFENFVVGKCNEQAFRASINIINEPGTKYNPLFIYGPSGLGKTHLLESIKLKYEAQYEGIDVRYFTVNQIKERVKNIFHGTQKKESVEDFKNELKDLDVLLIDDIQLLKGGEKTSEIFFDVFNDLITNGKQIVITSDNAPTQLLGLDRRIVSRFTSGLIIKIDNLDIETTKKLINVYAKKYNINTLSPNMLTKISNSIKNDVREINGLFMKLEFWNQNVTEETIEELITQSGIKIFGETTQNKIIEIVAKHYDLTSAILKSNNRTQKVVQSRNVCIYLIKDVLGKSTTDIEIFFKKNRTTISASINTVIAKMSESKEFKREITVLKKKIKESE
ncbi:DnaA ATPase domain-containing protein [Spiroplasma endosymbiont of Othius punctulatus]|uniref:DnaA ATPase domain-containing protein n=1 Tax=Spiroplasma endosymbiont of Othius punctulatus TaxID=3066289 RepID=UPI0030D47F41